MTPKVRKLAPEDDRSAFRSGNEDPDRFFARYADQNQFRHHIGTTYVAVDERGMIAGFATVAASELSPVAMPASKQKRLPMYPVPVLRLARLAVDQRAKGQRVGTELLRAVLALAAQMSDEFGCVGVIVDAKPEAIPFYEKLGFLLLEVVSGALGDRPQPQPMFLELGQLLDAGRSGT